MSMHRKRAIRMSRQYDTYLRLHGGDMEDTLTRTIEELYPSLSEDAQADLYAAVYQSFSDYPSGVTRRIALTSALQSWNLRRIYG